MPHALINQLGSVVGFLGMSVCLAAALYRLAGQYFLASVPLSTLFLGGVGLVASGCFLKLHVISRPRGDGG